MILKLSPLLLLVVSQSSYAITGAGVFSTRAVDHPSLCKIVVKNKGSCTGTLVDSKTIYTAGHCFFKDGYSPANPITADCGDSGPSPVYRVSVPPGKQWDGDKPIAQYDFAVLTLSFDSKSEPSKVATDPNLYFSPSMLNPGVNCFMLGFGQTDVGGHSGIGDLMQTNLEQVIVAYGSLTQMIQLQPINGEEALRTSVDHGDSGGPVFCQAPGHDVELVGTIVNYSLMGKTKIIWRNFISAVWAHSAKN